MVHGIIVAEHTTIIIDQTLRKIQEHYWLLKIYRCARST